MLIFNSSRKRRGEPSSRIKGFLDGVARTLFSSTTSFLSVSGFASPPLLPSVRDHFVSACSDRHGAGRGREAPQEKTPKDKKSITVCVTPPFLPFWGRKRGFLRFWGRKEGRHSRGGCKTGAMVYRRRTRFGDNKIEIAGGVLLFRQENVSPSPSLNVGCTTAKDRPRKDKSLEKRNPPCG